MKNGGLITDYKIMRLDDIKIQDNIFDDPDCVREKILQNKFNAPGPSGTLGPAWRCDLENSKEIEQKLSKLWGFQVEPVHLEARYSLADANSNEVNPFVNIICHNDYGVSDYTAVVYLTLQQYCQGGTDFFKYLPADTLKYHPALGRVEVEDSSKWQHVFTAEMKFNRLVTYPSALFHSVKRPFFGTNLIDSRLILSVRFNRVRRPKRY